jgi:pyruvate/2-oxoglutarate dehydrogenase complex dihydrolipoamide acyltransferase (E2) component
MSARSPVTVDPEAVRAIVAEVLRRIGPVVNSDLPAPPSTASEAPAPAVTPAPAAGGVSLPGRVISLAMLEKLPAGTGRVTVEATAVITPSAREYARDKGLVIDRVSAAAGRPAAISLPFVVAHAECGSDVATRAAAIARAVPNAARLPATGLTDVVTAFALHASRDGARGILLTGKPAVACVLANRSASLRAVTARDPATLAAAANECSANLLVVDPAIFPAAALIRTAGELASRPATQIPAPLAARPAGCGCKGH